MLFIWSGVDLGGLVLNAIFIFIKYLYEIFNFKSSAYGWGILSFFLYRCLLVIFSVLARGQPIDRLANSGPCLALGLTVNSN
mgnify:FL=1